MVGLEIDFHYRFIKAWEEERLSVLDKAWTPYAVAHNENGGSENRRRVDGG